MSIIFYTKIQFVDAQNVKIPILINLFFSSGFSHLQYTRPLDDVSLTESAINYQHQAQSVQNNLMNASVSIKSPTLDKNKNNASNIFSPNSINYNVQPKFVSNAPLPKDKWEKSMQKPTSPGTRIITQAIN